MPPLEPAGTMEPVSAYATTIAATTPHSTTATRALVAVSSGAPGVTGLDMLALMALSLDRSLRRYDTRGPSVLSISSETHDTNTKGVRRFYSSWSARLDLPCPCTTTPQ